MWLIIYTHPIILSDLPPNHPGANLLNMLTLAYDADQEFRKKCDELSLKSLCEVQQQHHIDLMNAISEC